MPVSLSANCALSHVSTEQEEQEEVWHGSSHCGVYKCVLNSPRRGSGVMKLSGIVCFPVHIHIQSVDLNSRCVTLCRMCQMMSLD